MDFNNSDLYTPHLKIQKLVTENQETPIHFITNMITPTEYFFRRNHFSYPQISQQSFLLPIYGQVNTPLTFLYDYIRSMPHRSIA